MFEPTCIGLHVHAVNVVGHSLNPDTDDIARHTMVALRPLQAAATRR